MQYPAAFGFSGVYPLGFLPCAGLHLLALRQFQAFLASSARPACASSFCFCSAVRLRSVLGLAVVATRLPRHQRFDVFEQQIQVISIGRTRLKLPRGVPLASGIIFGVHH